MNEEEINWNEMLLESAKNKNFEKVKESIDNGADVNFRHNNHTALCYAVENQHIEMTKYLIENGAYVNIKCMYDFGDMVGIEELAYTDTFKSFLTQTKQLFLFADNGDADSISDCLKVGVCVDARRSDSKTALMIASQKGNYKATITLISAGANISTKDKDDKTALNYAAESKNIKLMELLLSRGANSNKNN